MSSYSQDGSISKGILTVKFNSEVNCLSDKPAIRRYLVII